MGLGKPNVKRNVNVHRRSLMPPSPYEPIVQYACTLSAVANFGSYAEWMYITVYVIVLSRTPIWSIGSLQMRGPR